jgi:NAD(P)-dependent dehydrogenase (short-subunit alcohol dehydrogenase family)
MTRKIALVTGAGKGIGLATAKQLIAAGRFVVLLDSKPIDIEKLGLSENDALCF